GAGSGESWDGCCERCEHVLVDGKYTPLDSGSPTALTKALMNVAAPFLALFAPGVSAMVATGGVLADLFARKNVEDRLEAMREEIVRQAGELDQVTLATKLASELAREALTLAVRQAMFTPRLERAKRFGAVVGSQLASTDPNWTEAIEMIQDLER